MANVPIRIMYTSITGDHMYCTKHEKDITGEPDRKGTTPQDFNWNMCPGLEAEIEALDPDYLARSAAAADMTVEEYLEDLDMEDRAQWMYVIDIDDATVTIG